MFSGGNMLEKNKLGKTIFLTIVMAILTQPAKADISGFEPELGLPVMETLALETTTSKLLVISQQKHINNGIYPEYPSQKNVEESIPDGAEFMISSVPVIIQNQVTKNTFTANIPNDQGGYSTVILQKSGNRFIELTRELYPGIPLITQ
jgi:hypothetical protein